MIRHVIGFDDGPFPVEHRGDVLLVGAVFSGRRLDGVLTGKVRRDGANATRAIVELVRGSRHRPQLQAVLTQGIAFGGFNVVDLDAIHAELRVPIVTVCRRRPDLNRVRDALLSRVHGGQRKWKLIQAAGLPEGVAGLYIQRKGVSLQDAADLIESLAVHSALPEPLRTAHIIAGGVVDGESRHRP